MVSIRTQPVALPAIPVHSVSWMMHGQPERRPSDVAPGACRRPESSRIIIGPGDPGGQGHRVFKACPGLWCRFSYVPSGECPDALDAAQTTSIAPSEHPIRLIVELYRQLLGDRALVAHAEHQVEFVALMQNRAWTSFGFAGLLANRPLRLSMYLARYAFAFSMSLTPRLPHLLTPRPCSRAAHALAQHPSASSELALRGEMGSREQQPRTLLRRQRNHLLQNAPAAQKALPM